MPLPQDLRDNMNLTFISPSIFQGNLGTLAAYVTSLISFNAYLEWI